MTRCTTRNKKTSEMSVNSRLLDRVRLYTYRNFGASSLPTFHIVTVSGKLEETKT